MYQLYVNLPLQEAEAYLSSLTAPAGIAFGNVQHDWYGSPYLPFETTMFTDVGVDTQLEQVIQVPYKILKVLTYTRCIL